MNRFYRRFYLAFLLSFAISISSSIVNAKTTKFIDSKHSTVRIRSSSIPKLKQINHFEAHQIKGEALVRLNYSPNGDYLVTSASDSFVKIWRSNGALVKEIAIIPKRIIFNARFNSTSTEIIAAVYNGRAPVWSLAGEKLREFKGHSSAITDAAFIDGGAVTCSDDGSLKLWKSNGDSIASIPQMGVVRNLAVSPNGRVIASTQDLGVVTLVDIQGKIIQEIKTGQGRLNSVYFHPQGNLIVTAGFDGTARIWNLKGEQQVLVKVLTKGWVTEAKFSPDGQKLATVSDDGILKLWNLSGNLLGTFKSNGERLSSLSFHPTKKELTTVSYGGEVWTLRIP